MDTPENTVTEAADARGVLIRVGDTVATHTMSYKQSSIAFGPITRMYQTSYGVNVIVKNTVSGRSITKSSHGVVKTA